jgi:hypothetical protein
MWDYSLFCRTSKMSHDRGWRAACVVTIKIPKFHFDVREEARGVTAMVVYVRTSVNRFIRTEVEKKNGADRSLLLPVSLDARKRPCSRTVSLRAKRDDREQSTWNAPALIAGEIVDLDVAINPGGAIQLT